MQHEYMMHGLRCCALSGVRVSVCIAVHGRVEQPGSQQMARVHVSMHGAADHAAVHGVFRVSLVLIAGSTRALRNHRDVADSVFH